MQRCAARVGFGANGFLQQRRWQTGEIETVSPTGLCDLRSTL